MKMLEEKTKKQADLYENRFEYDRSDMKLIDYLVREQEVEYNAKTNKNSISFETRKIGEKEVYVTPKNDFVFKRIFGISGHEEILKDFLESILEIKIDSLKVDLDKELLPQFYGEKKSSLDVRTDLSDGTQVNIEIQVSNDYFSEDRILTYWSKLFLKKIEVGEDYVTAHKTIGIWILDKTYYKTFEKYHSKWQIQESEEGYVGKFDKFELHIIELQKFRNSAIQKQNNKEFWLSFIDYTDREMVKMGCEKLKKIEEAKKVLDEIYSDEQLSWAFVDFQLAEIDRKFARTAEKMRKEELERQEKEVKQKTEEFKQKTEEFKQKSEEFKQKSEELEQKSEEMKKREESLKKHEKELKRREEEYKNKNKETAKKLKVLGIPTEDIKSMTALSDEEINKL